MLERADSEYLTNNLDIAADWLAVLEALQCLQLEKLAHPPLNLNAESFEMLVPD